MVPRRIRYRWWLGLFLLLGGALEDHARNVEIEITGIRSERGQIILEIYTDSESFKKEKPVQRKIFPKSGIREETLTVELDLNAGTCGLALIDDENSNGKMDYHMIRLTEEGFAFSDFYLVGLKKPDFDDFKFVVEKGRKRKVIIRIRYM